MEDDRIASTDIMCSFIIPVYNNAEYLEDCLASIYDSCLNSTSKMEIVLIDDGSTDESSEKLDVCLLQSIDRENSGINNEKVNVSIVHTTNHGVSGARNLGLRISSGKYIVFIDSDDTVDSHKMLECVNTLLKHQTIDMLIYGLSFDYYRKGVCYRSTVANPPFAGTKDIEECRVVINDLFDANTLSSLCNRIIKKQVISDIYLCENLFICEDLEFVLRTFANCKRLFFYNEAVYHYRQNEMETNSINRLKRVNSIRDIIDKIEEALHCVGDDGEHILTSIYSLLAIDKIKGSKKNEIKAVCDEYRAWIDHKGYKTKNSLLYAGDVNKIRFQLFISKVRHRVANFVKSI